MSTMTGPETFAFSSRVSEWVDLAHTFGNGCPVNPQDLRHISFSHWTFDGSIDTGTMVVHHRIEELMETVLGVAFDERFPIQQAVPLDDERFRGDDELSMAANNSSCFNYRQIAGTTKPSNHSYGAAVDINPVQNPYQYADGHWGPESEIDYRDRDLGLPGMFSADHPVVRAFTDAGFEWGGTWERPDYHHFEAQGLVLGVADFDPTAAHRPLG